MVSRGRHVGLVLFLVRLGQTHMLACATWLGVGADTVSRCRHLGLVLFLDRIGKTLMLVRHRCRLG